MGGIKVLCSPQKRTPHEARTWQTRKQILLSIILKMHRKIRAVEWYKNLILVKKHFAPTPRPSPFPMDVVGCEEIF